MTSKITSRFRRRSEATAPGAPETSGTPVAETIETKSEAAQPDAAATPVKTETAEAVEPKSDAKPEAAPVMGPARLVEVEKPKPAPQADIRPAKAWLSNAHSYRVPAAAAAALVAALVTGYGLGVAGQFRDAGNSSAKSAALLANSAKDLREAHGQIGQLTAELKSLKGAVEGMKGDREKSRGDLLAKQTQISERLERTGQENATRIGRLAEQLDRIEKANRQASADKATDKAEKPEKVAAAPLPPPKPVRDVAHTGSLADPKAAADPKHDPRKTVLEGYVVRDYDDGYALIETRQGRFIDVAVGYTLPGVGKVEAIERRGRQWVVVTPKGYIGER